MSSPAEPLSYFPLKEPREKQVKGLDFIRRAHEKGYRDIVIAAPTGVGKTGIGMAACLWAAQPLSSAEKGGYYLVTQKLLQDQIERDFARFVADYSATGCTLKSAIEYPCPQYTTCMAGGRMRGPMACREKKKGFCAYSMKRKQFMESCLSVTNYPYFFTERSYVQQFNPRNLVVADECHTLEKQVLGFVDVHITPESLQEWAPFLRPMPALPQIEEFATWLQRKYAPAVYNRMEMLHERLTSNHRDQRLQIEYNKLENHHNKTQSAAKDMLTAPAEWIYWQEPKDDDIESTAKPLYADRFFKPLVQESASLRLYLSAYPGPKPVFCRNLGLEPSEVAWINLNSTFLVEHRPVHLLLVGSMGRKSMEDTTPRLLRMCEKIIRSHSSEKGLVHCHSYKLGDTIYDYLCKTDQANRIIYPRKADDRAKAFESHLNGNYPTVLLSPSMSEGFSLDDDLARFQIIAKIPYPNLGDRQVSAKAEIDPEWYTLQTATTIIQACGRIVRSDEDYGTTYVLDSDFMHLYERNNEFFPRWFQDAFVWHR
jgi:ATP-dependent DNA helicase DinG